MNRAIALTLLAFSAIALGGDVQHSKKEKAGLQDEVQLVQMAMKLDTGKVWVRNTRDSNETSLELEPANLESKPLALSHANEFSISSVSLNESQGFFHEPNAVWRRRKERQIDQMNLQEELMTKCPDGSVHKECLVGCSGKSAACEGRFFWQAHYEPSFSCMYKRRLGLQGEGGKWVCDPYKITDQVAKGSGCLVYSVGSHGKFDFEKSVNKDISSGCEIHTIDMDDWKTYGIAPPEYVKYHKYTIGPPPNTTISSLVQKLGHAQRTIDLFKIDCEGCEWSTYKSWFGNGVYIRQILVELHGGHEPLGQNAHEFFKTLFDMGYVVFSKESNTLGCQGDCIEYGFVRLSPDFSRASSHM
mmetsp:Transcript_119960/g.231384  ORF Transcript_119960/g.231384 Transcript_119960/m.231384 type:complete len:358 (-) Transcript_119960:46-1119(-)